MRKSILVVLSSAAALLILITLGNKIIGGSKINGNFWEAAVLDTAPSKKNFDLLTTSTPTITDLLQQFQNQIKSVNTQLADLNSTVEILDLKNTFKRTLKLGDTGDDVSKLQELFIKFPDLFSPDASALDTATGFYGSLTKISVAQFQSQSGLPKTGIFDSTTREKFYESITELSKQDVSSKSDSMDISSITGLNTGDNSLKQISASTDIPAKDSQSPTTQNNPDTATNTQLSDLQNQVSQLSADVATAKLQITDLQNQVAQLPSPTASYVTLP